MSIRYNVAAVAHRMRQDAEAYVHQPAGMTWAAFRTLFALRVLGPSSPRDIAQVTYVSGPSISSVLNRLERDRLIVRQKPIGGDGRTITVALTEEGLSVLTTLFQRNHAREAEWAKVLNERERKTLVRLLRRLLEGEPQRP
jgi:DNA-binding MarR family transcriptional regulator